MRTTLQIDDDVLQAVKQIAASRKISAGRVLSDLARQELQQMERQPIAELTAIEKSSKKRLLGQCRGEVVIADDFDDPVDPVTWR